MFLVGPGLLANLEPLELQLLGLLVDLVPPVVLELQPLELLVDLELLENLVGPPVQVLVDPVLLRFLEILAGPVLLGLPSLPVDLGLQYLLGLPLLLADPVLP